MTVWRNGFAFLMTLPFGRKTYVKEKYLFSLIMTVAAWCFGSVVNIAITISRHGGAGLADDLIMATAAIPSIYMVVGIIIPLQLKYGSEKSRLVLFGIFGICAVLIYAVKALPIDAVKPLVGLFNSLQGLPGYSILLALVTIGLFMWVFIGALGFSFFPALGMSLIVIFVLIIGFLGMI